MEKTGKNATLKQSLDSTLNAMERVVATHKPGLKPEEVGVVNFVGRGIVRLSGMDSIRAEELVRFPGDLYGLVFNIDPDEVGVILLDP
ncbi:MAG TPA: F0F1 ATP synthase subunit alpha, partial [Deltaproteobacteria bacterium]|nr:F0F1 ATP synthase subunit alpha [Deltaproteobacteria bacterium]